MAFSPGQRLLVPVNIGPFILEKIGRVLFEA